MKLLSRWFFALALLALAVPTFAQVSESNLKKIEAALPEKAFAQPKQPRHLLIYSKTLGFRHGSIPTGAAAIKMLGEKTGAYTAEHSEDPAMFDENRLSKFDAVLFLNTTGDCLAPKKGQLSPDEQATLEQRKKNLLAFVQGGKGFAGIHSATDTFYSWKEYGDMIGAWFTNHPWGNVPLKVDSPNSPLTKMFDAEGFDIKDEIYQFAPKSASGQHKGYQPYSREKLHVLLSIDGSKFQQKGARPDEDYGISWIREHGKGRVFYCALGHSDHMYWHPDMLKHYLAGLQYALGDLPADATPSASARGSDQDFVPLFNGKDLSGWVNVNCAPNTFTVKDGMIFCTGQPFGVLRTDKHYENFILELEYMHEKKGGNSGLFVWSDPLPAVGVPFTRSIEVQIMDGVEKRDEKGRLLYTSDGDIFSIQGATCKPDRPHPAGWARSLPSEKRAKPAGQWNHYRVECNDGAIKLAVNGKVVSGIHDCNPRMGYICLESEGAPIWFKNIKIKVLPSTDAKSEEVAELAKGFRPLYTGIDLAGWKHTEEMLAHWQPKSWILDYNGKSKDLWTTESFGDFEMIVDWKFTRKPVKMQRPIILPSGEYDLDAEGKQKTQEVLDAGDSGIYLRGSGKAQINIWCWPVGSGEVWGYRNDKKQPPEVRAGVTPKVKADKAPGQWNRFHITMKGDRLTVLLNGQTVIDNAQLPGVPKSGPIALQHHGDPIQFANIFIRELK